MSVRRSLVASVTNRFAGVIMQILSSLVIARLLAGAPEFPFSSPHKELPRFVPCLHTI